LGQKIHLDVRAVPIEICLGKAKTANIKTLHNTEILAERYHVTGKTMRVLEIEAETSVSIIIDGIVPCRIKTGLRNRGLEKV
jgi:hypothetical protein